MSTPDEGIERWREYFRTANADIFEIIERGILVAASDHPQEFKLRRDRIAEVLFSSRLIRCTNCDGVELSAPEHDEGGRGLRIQFNAGGSNESKVQSIKNDQIGVALNPLSNYSYGEAELLTEEIEEQTSAVQEVLRIKEVLNNFKDESDSVLLESLRRLQLMRLTFDVLRATEIGKTVNGLRKHGEVQIRHLVRELIAEWKSVVDDYMETVRDIAETAAGSDKATPESFNPSGVDDEEGLPSPPLDDCVFFATQNIDFSQFFDGMDDDGNPQNSGAINKKQKSVRTPAFKPDVALMKEPSKQEVLFTKKDNILPLRKQHESVPKPLSTIPGASRPIKPTSEQRVNPTQKIQKQTDKPNIPSRPSIQSEKIRCSNEVSVKEKLEAAKRKLQERYQEAENAKRQRTIQIMELHDLPKQGIARRNVHNKFGNSTRNSANGRR